MFGILTLPRSPDVPPVENQGEHKLFKCGPFPGKGRVGSDYPLSQARWLSGDQLLLWVFLYRKETS